MLTIEEIKKALDAGETVELECIDVYRFMNNNKGRIEEREEILSSTLVVDSVDGGCSTIWDSNYFLRESDLEYFRIKKKTKSATDIASHDHKDVTSGAETTQRKDNPTFDDLVDVAVKAHKDGLIKSLKLLDCGLRSLSYSVGFNDDEITIFSQHKDYSDGVDFINSLYTETFVIESQEDTLKIDTLGGEIIKVVLANNEVLSSNYLDCLCDISDGFRFKILKGATVTQKRGAL